MGNRESEPYKLLKSDGTEEIVTPRSGKKFTPAEVRGLVGGSFELASLSPKRRREVDKNWCGFRSMVDADGFVDAYASGGLVREGWVLVVNDDGRNLRLPVNQQASELWGAAEIVGDVLLCRTPAV